MTNEQYTKIKAFNDLLVLLYLTDIMPVDNETTFIDDAGFVVVTCSTDLIPLNISPCNNIDWV